MRKKRQKRLDKKEFKSAEDYLEDTLEKTTVHDKTQNTQDHQDFMTIVR